MTSKPMNRFILPVLTAVTLLASCSSAITDTEEFAKLNESKLQEAKAFVSKVKFKVSAVPVNGQPLRNTFKVTLTDLQTISADKQVTRNATPTVNSIEPVIYNNDTIMYLVNYQKGWRLYSVDKRMPTILAENLVETGKKATDILNNKGIRFWVADIAGQTAYLSQTDEYDENSENLQQWSGQSRGIKRIPIQPVPGEYIYVGREEVSRTTVYQPHLTKTLWHGDYPFNLYCPTISAYSDYRCDAGCVAVSIGQYMYFLQDKLGYSFQMPLLGSCIGAYNEEYVQSFTRFSTWSLANLALTDNFSLYGYDQFDKVALAIGYIGKQASINYGLTGSSSSYTPAQNFLNNNGVKGSFEAITSRSFSLTNLIFDRGEPVLTGGVKEKNGGGHMFLIDGGKYDIVEYEDVWRFLEDTTFYDPDRYGVILREPAGSMKTNYHYLCNLGWNFDSTNNGSDADNTYYAIDDIRGYNTGRKYFNRKK